MNHLFSELQLKRLTLKNRVVMAPMCMYQAKEGYVNNWHRIHYASRAVGGVGLIIMEAAAVLPEGRISDADLGLWSDDFIEGLKSVTDLAHEQGAKIGIQLAHAGRKSMATGSTCVAPSPVAFSHEYSEPLALSLEDIQKTVKAFGEAAARAVLAGYDTVEIHGAHGYLINQFMSPLCNFREDGYGGSVQNRSRFLSEVIQSVRQNVPEDFPIILRISGEEYAEGGNGPKDVAHIVNMATPTVDLLNVSSGGVTPSAMVTYPGYQLEIARHIKEITQIPVMVGGLITEAKMAEEIICNNRGDLVYLGRELLRNPYWTLQAARELHVDFPWPASYTRA